MIQKATWIIPGILVTLLLGLLWAMPAFAAEAGEISFLDGTGKKAISYLSLDGMGGPEAGAITLSVEDQDLNEPTSFIGKTALTKELADTPVSNGRVDAIDWTNLADRNDDGTLNYKDFTAFIANTDTDLDGNIRGDSDDVAVEVARGDIVLDTQNGTMVWTLSDDGTNTASHLEFMLYETDTMGGRATYKLTSAAAGEPAVGRPDVIAGVVQPPVTTPVVPWTWADLGDTDGNGKINAADVTARNAGAAATEVDLTVTITDGDRDDDGDGNPLTPDVNGVNINNITGAAAADQNWINIMAISVGNTDDPDTADGPMTAATVGEIPGTVTADVTDPAAVPVNVLFTYSVQVREVGKLDDGSVTNRVMVSSEAANSAISVILRETAPNSGKFQAKLNICDSSLATCKASKQAQTTDEMGATEKAEDSSGTDAVTIPVNKAGDTITVAYSDASPSTTRRARIALDINPPSLSGFSPESGTAGADDEPELSFEVVDAESGISDFDKSKKTPLNSIRAVVALYEPGESKPFAGPVTFRREDLSDDDAVTGGFAVSFEVSEGEELPSNRLNLDSDDKSQYEIRWWAVAMDQAGNTGVSDQKEASSLTGQVAVKKDSTTVTGTTTKFTTEIKVGQYIEVSGEERKVQRITSDLVLVVTAPFDEPTENAIATTGACYSETFAYAEGNVNSIEMAGCDPNIFRVDNQNPTMTEAVTGTILGDDDKPKADNSLTSIQVTFDEALDCDTVSADDFEVDGTVPNAANCNGSSVYLDVDELDRDDKPEVELVGAVMDKAGNILDADDDDDLRTQEAKDGIGAKVTTSVVGTGEGDRPITDRRITVTVISDERLSSSPMVEIRKVGNNYELETPISGTGVPTGNTNEWTFERNFTAAGLYNVYVSGSNVGSASSGSTDGLSGQVIKDGVATDEYKFSKDGLEEDGIILFEVDRGVASPTFKPADDGSTDNPNVFIRIDFAPEGKEYAIAAKCVKEDAVDKTVNSSGACDDDDYDVSSQDVDSSGLVVITKATFDGEDVLEDIISRDGALFVYRPGSLSLGDHKLEIEAMDNAGNDGKGKGFSTEFTVTERKPYTLDINPGSNLVSLPANPVDGDINTVFGGEGNEDIITVVTFDNISGLWMTATKGEDGMFMGDLTKIDAMHGYWVVADGVIDVDVLLSAGGLVGITPPSIPVQKGWNLVGVVDTAQGKGDDEGVFLAKDYFANVEAEVVYGYDALSGVLGRISAGDTSKDTVSVGAAYWVYANEAGIIIP